MADVEQWRIMIRVDDGDPEEFVPFYLPGDNGLVKDPSLLIGRDYGDAPDGRHITDAWAERRIITEWERPKAWSLEDTITYR